MTMKAIVCKDQTAAGMTLEDVPLPTLKAKHVLVKIHATAVNRADLLQRQGSYPPPPGESDIIGLEMSGVVHEVGPDCALGWKAGDRVCGLLAGGGYAEFVVVPEGSLFAIPRLSESPEGTTFEQAAAIPEAFLTAFQAVCLLAELQPGEKILVHAGASGVGICAIQIARSLGAIPYACVGSQDKIEFCEKYGAEKAFNRKDVDFAEVVSALGGVDVVIDFIGGPYFQSNLRVLKEDGRMVMLGFLGGPAVPGEANVGQILRKRLTIRGSTLRNRTTAYKANLVSRFVQFAGPLFENGQLKVLVDRVYPIQSAGDAHEYIAKDENKGKVVLRVSP